MIWPRNALARSVSGARKKVSGSASSTMEPRSMRRLERDPAAERQRGLDGHAVERHRKIGAREAVAMHVAGGGRLAAERFIDLLPVDVLRMGLMGTRES